jgi:hypothetical protein
LAEEEEILGALKSASTRAEARLASTDDRVARERGVKGYLAGVAKTALATAKAFRAAAATAWAEVKRLWEVAVHAATFAVAAAAAAASARTPAARTMIKGVAHTAARAAVAVATAAWAGYAACLEGLIVAARAAAAEEVERGNGSRPLRGRAAAEAKHPLRPPPCQRQRRRRHPPPPRRHRRWRPGRNVLEPPPPPPPLFRKKLRLLPPTRLLALHWSAGCARLPRSPPMA